MLKKSRIWRIVLLLVVIVMANLYFGCVQKYYPPDYGSQKEQEAQIEELQNEMEELKQQQ